MFFLFFFIISTCLEINVYSASTNKTDNWQSIQSRCNALIILNTNSISEFFVSINRLKKLDVKPFHIFPQDGVIGYIPDGLDAIIENKFPDVRIYRKGKMQINAFDNDTTKNENNIALKIWKDNYLSNKNTIKNADHNESEIFCAGALYPPPERNISLQNKFFETQSVNNSHLPYGATSSDTSEFMAGSIAIGIIMPENTGNAEKRTNEEIDNIHSYIQKGIDWWISQAPEKSNLSFIYEFHNRVPVLGEPDADINYGYKNGYQAMNALGYYLSYGNSSDYSVQSLTRNFNNDLRDKYKTNWGVTIFLIDRGSSSQKMSFSYYGGPYLVVHYKKITSHLGELTAHELAHSFYAADEYIPDINNPPICSEKFGYLHKANNNATVCENIDPCIMRSTRIVESCIFTRGQMGLIDTDGDEIPDVLDTFPVVKLSDLNNVTFSSSKVSFSGTAKVSRLKNLNTFNSKHDLTINNISAIEFRIDDGTWIKAEDKNGSLQQYTTNFTITTPHLSNSIHKIDVRAVNSAGNKSITPATRTFTVNSAETSLIIKPLALKFEVNKNTGTSESLPLNVSFSDQTAHNWQISNASTFIQTDKTSGAGDDSVIVTVDISGKSVGTYEENIQISSPDITESLQTIPVCLSIIDAPDFIINIDSINIKRTAWNPKDETSLNPPYENLKIINRGGKSIPWTSSATAPWIKLFPSSGNTSSQSLIMIDIKNLKGGVHNTGIKIQETGVTSVSNNIPVTLDLCDVPIITSVVPDKVITGEDITIYGDNFGDSKVNQILRFRTNKSIVIEPKSWSNKEIHIEMPEIYGKGYFTIKNDCGLSSPSRNVTVSPILPPEIDLNKSRIDYILNAEDEKIITASLGISNSSNGILSWKLTTDVPWINLITTSGNGSMMVNFYINLQNYSESKYEGNVVVTSEYAGNSPVTVPVSVTIRKEEKHIPTITSINPFKTIYRHKLTIIGKYFGATSGVNNIVLIDNINAKIKSWNDSMIIVKIPFGTSTGKVKIYVVTTEGKSNKKKCRVLRPIPKIMKISEQLIKNNNFLFSISGNNFGNIEGKVLTGKISSELLKWKNKKIEILIPASEIKARNWKISFKVKTMYEKSRKKTLILKNNFSKSRTLWLNHIRECFNFFSYS